MKSLDGFPAWQAKFLRLAQTLVVDARLRGLSRPLWWSRRQLAGTGIHPLPYRDRFWVLTDTHSNYQVMRICGYIHLYHDRFLRDWVPGNAKEKLQVIDIGANEGFVSLLAYSAARKDQQVELHAFEPNPTAFNILAGNLRLNGWQAELNPIALGEQPGEAVLTLGAATSNSTLVDHGLDYVASVGTRSVRVETLDGYCAGKGICPDLVKIDVEGFEIKVLRGAQETLRRCMPVLILEVNSKALRAAGVSAEELFDTLVAMGYQAYALEPRRLNPGEPATARPAWRGLPAVERQDFAGEVFFDIVAIPAARRS